MKTVLAIRERKTIRGGGDWKRGRMPRSAFPLSRSHSYRLGSGWDWAVYRLAGSSHRYRLLIAFDALRAQYQAWLGVEDGADQALIARLEHHPSHKGWHCHVKKGDLDTVLRGVVRVPRHRERSVTCRGRARFQFKESDAIATAFKVFNVVTDDPQGLL